MAILDVRLVGQGGQRGEDAPADVETGVAGRGWRLRRPGARLPRRVQGCNRRRLVRLEEQKDLVSGQPRVWLASMLFAGEVIYNSVKTGKF